MSSQFQDFDALLSANMDDLDDLPPMGVPPTGHYNLEVTAERKASKDKTGEYIEFSYVVLAVNEVKNAEEADQAAHEMKFSERFSPFKKDGTINEYGIGFLKEACKPFSAHFGTSTVGETIQQIQKIVVATELVRRVDKKDPERFNFSLKNVTVL